jgi:hypothetical protein
MRSDYITGSSRVPRWRGVVFTWMRFIRRVTAGLACRREHLSDRQVVA